VEFIKHCNWRNSSNIAGRRLSCLSDCEEERNTRGENCSDDLWWHCLQWWV